MANTHSRLVEKTMLALQEKWPSALIENCSANGQYKELHSERRVTVGLPGKSDIVACINGRYVSVECKVGKDRVKSHQAAYRQRIEGAGGLYIVCFDDPALLVSALESLLHGPTHTAH